MIKNLLLLPFLLSAVIIHAQSLVNNSQSGPSEYHLLNYSIFSVPSKDLIVIQNKNLNAENTNIELLNKKGKVIQKVVLFQGSTIAFFDTKTLYAADYLVKISDIDTPIIQEITLLK